MFSLIQNHVLIICSIITSRATTRGTVEQYSNHTLVQSDFKCKMNESSFLLQYSFKQVDHFLNNQILEVALQ